LMLALPVNPAAEPTPPPAPAFPDPPEPPAGNMILSDPLPPVSPPAAAAVQWPVPPPEPVPLPLLNPVPLAERRAPVLPPPGRARPAPRRPEPPLLLRPILWLTRGFAGLAFSPGSPGRWLRRPAGRTLLGIAGLALLAAAVALALLDRIGWTW